MNRAKLTSLKLDLSRRGVHWSTLVEIPARTARMLARSTGIRARHGGKQRRRVAPQQQQKAPNWVDKVKAAFRKVIRP
jgi:hypothetical protein